MANLNIDINSVKSHTQVVEFLELDNGIVQITMKDEENRNTFSQQLVEGLHKCFDKVAQSNRYKVVILTGYGNYFCLGGTKEQLISVQKGKMKFSDFNFFRFALDCKIPVIAAMQGHAFGGGFVFGLYADLVVLSQESIYTTNFMKYGFTPGFGSTLILPKKLGCILGQEMIYTTQKYRGKELEKRGVAFSVVPKQEVLNHAISLANKIAENSRLCLVTLKEHLASEIKEKLLKFVDKELEMHERTLHRPEVASRIEKIYGEINIIKKPHSLSEAFPQVYNSEVTNTSQLFLQKQMNRQEEILYQLQSGNISLENAEQMLLSFTEEELEIQDISKQVNNSHNKPISSVNSEEILSLLSVGEISLENAENLLLEIAEPHPKAEVYPKLETNELIEINQDIKTTDIAIIGISCRYAGAKNPKEFWENLKNGIDSVKEVPPGRWEEKNWYHPDQDHPGTSYSKSNGFLDEIDKFDPLFFEISPAEAQFMDPQQRIFLEEAYHAIEDAGYAPDSLKSQKCGVFVGVIDSGYNQLLLDSGLGANRFTLTGNQLSIVPARIAYFLDLKGPVVAIDTACSSSLVAVHQACESIQRGESELAIAGGITIMATANMQILTSQFQMLSPEGHCKTFDASASGTVWGEGCGIVLLKRYDRAIQDNDHIYGIIKGTGINYDGNTNGISAPSSQSQTNLEESVYRKFGINPETISYVEAHGTATALGDPIEVEALTNAFSKWTNKKQFCAIGSVKTNIGHAACSAGVSGLIKTILCLKHQKLVPSLHFNQPNPHIDFENSPFYVNTEFKDWKIADGKTRRAAVSSFGFSGTNAHVVVEEPSLAVKNRKSKFKTQNNLEPSFHLLTLSANCEKALQELAQNYHEFLGSNSTASIADICFSVHDGRSHFDHRLALVAESVENLHQKLKDFETGKATSGLLRGQVTNKNQPKIVFLFTGQGSQYVNMGRELYSTQPTFRKTLEQCDRILSPYLDKSLLSILYPQAGEIPVIDETVYTQPTLFAIEYALYKLWESWGIKPDIVMGHSVGEYVAATIAGVFSLEDGLKLIAHRGRLMQQLPLGGEMLSVMASEKKVNQIIAPYLEKVAIAAINGSQSIVISGESEAVGTVKEILETQEIKTKKLQVSHAFHSHLMEPMLAEFEVIASEITYNQPTIPIVSNVTGVRAEDNITTSDYWVNHVRQPVKFGQSIENLYQEGYEIFLEIGAKPILLGMGRQCLPENVGIWLPSLRPSHDDWQQILQSLGKLYVQGVKVDWLGFDKDYSHSKVVLPTYPFQRQRYWIENNQNTHKKQYLTTSKNIHPLLGKTQNS